MRHDAKPVDEQRPIVLLVDDSEDVHRVLRVKLRNEDFELVSCYSGEEACARAVELRPATILLDLDMPGMAGLAVLRALKERPDTQDIPIVIVSALSTPTDKVAAFELGAADYITKPFEFTELRVRLRAALNSYRLIRLLAQRAQVDGLTGLWNRSYFDQRWKQEHARTERKGGKLALAIIDLDHFKQINDRHGHPAADQVLVSVAKTLRRMCRGADSPCRYGGEEFVLILPETGAADAGMMCDRVRTAIAAWRSGGPEAFSVTVSIGVVGCEGSAGKSAEQWVELADQNLYSAKREGRNRVVWTDVTPPARARLAG
jgi:two-component system, cell cycle response regulator